MSEVQKSISTIPRAPSSEGKTFTFEFYYMEYGRTHGVHSSERIAVGDAVTLTSANRYASRTRNKQTTWLDETRDVRVVLVEVCKEHVRIRLFCHGRRRRQWGQVKAAVPPLEEGQTNANTDARSQSRFEFALAKQICALPITD